MYTSLKDCFESLGHVFFPHLCLHCSEPIASHRVFCHSCQTDLPESHFQTYRKNPFTDRFFGRIPLYGAYCGFFLQTGSDLERVLYQLKYQDRPQIGTLLGRLIGQQMQQLHDWTPPDVLVPVPLHPRKKHLRGYNQSAAIAAGMQSVLHIPIDEQMLHRSVYTETQTAKGKMERQANVLGAFSLGKKGFAFEQKHILLVDDVLTTGATLEACAQRLLEIPNVQISLAALAMASF